MQNRKNSPCEESSTDFCWPFLLPDFIQREIALQAVYSRALFSPLQVQWWEHPWRVHPSTLLRHWPLLSPPPVSLPLSLASFLGSFFLASAEGTSMPTHTQKPLIWIQNSTSESSELLWMFFLACTFKIPCHGSCLLL